MAEHLKIDGYTMISAIQLAVEAKAKFDEAGSITSEVCGYVGETSWSEATAQLCRALRGASSGWSVHRADLGKALESLATALADCIEAFEETDQELAAGMRP